MHAEALAWVHQWTVGKEFPRVLDIGGLYVNGTPRFMVDHDRWVVVDVYPGSNVDIVADARYWRSPEVYDLVLCLEVFEHVQGWRDIIRTIYHATTPSEGMAIVTAACDPRAPHDAYGAVDVPPGQWYENVDVDLFVDLWTEQFDRVEVSVLARGDVRAVGWRT